MFKPSLLIATIALATACSGPGSSDAVSVASRTESTMNITEGQPMATADLSVACVEIVDAQEMISMAWW